MLKNWKELSHNEREMYALVDALNYAKTLDESGYNQLVGAWDESVMEVGDDYYNNADAVGGHAHKNDMYSEESYFACALFDGLKASYDIPSMIKLLETEYDHYFENRMIRHVDGGSMIFWTELAATFDLQFEEDIDENYIYQALFICDDCGWMMPKDEESSVETYGEVLCRECLPEEEEEEE